MVCQAMLCAPVLQQRSGSAERHELMAVACSLGPWLFCGLVVSAKQSVQLAVPCRLPASGSTAALPAAQASQILPSAGYNANLDAAGQSDARLALRLEENNSAFAGLSIDAAVSQMPRLQVPVVQTAPGNTISLSALLSWRSVAWLLRTSDYLLGPETFVHPTSVPSWHAALLLTPSFASPASCCQVPAVAASCASAQCHEHRMHPLCLPCASFIGMCLRCFEPTTPLAAHETHPCRVRALLLAQPLSPLASAGAHGVHNRPGACNDCDNPASRNGAAGQAVRGARGAGGGAQGGAPAFQLCQKAYACKLWQCCCLENWPHCSGLVEDGLS